jgi:predicted O-methyltransferase YrrM
MNDLANLNPPAILEKLILATEETGFKLASEPLTGSLLRTLAASKPSGKFLEIGTGTGIGTAWLLAGMDRESSLTTVENEKSLIKIARRFLGTDPRVTFCSDDAARLLETLPPGSFDFIFADTWAGKYTHLDEALKLLSMGGIYLIDDMLPQSTWADDHLAKMVRLSAELKGRSDLMTTQLDWGSGIVIGTKIGNAC